MTKQCVGSICYLTLIKSYLSLLLPLCVGGYQSWRTLSRKVHQHIDCSILNFAHIHGAVHLNESLKRVSLIEIREPQSAASFVGRF